MAPQPYKCRVTAAALQRELRADAFCHPALSLVTTLCRAAETEWNAWELAAGIKLGSICEEGEIAYENYFYETYYSRETFIVPLSHHIITLILACCILPAARQGFDFMLAILKVLFVIYWLVSDTKSVALDLITVVSNNLCGPLQLESKKWFKEIWKLTFQTLFPILLCFHAFIDSVCPE